MLISKKNEVYLRLINVEPSIAAELNDFFTFEVPGFKYMPAYRSKMWDGKIRLYNIVTGEIYVGLLPYIEEYLNNNGEDYEFADGITSKRDVARSVVQGFVRGLRPTLNGKRIEVRDYQLDAIAHAIATNRSLLISPTASGKSLIIYCLVRYYQMMELKTLILVPTTSLVEQMYKDFEDYGWSSGTYCQKIYQGHDKKVTDLRTSQAGVTNAHANMEGSMHVLAAENDGWSTDDESEPECTRAIHHYSIVHAGRHFPQRATIGFSSEPWPQSDRVFSPV